MSNKEETIYKALTVAHNNYFKWLQENVNCEDVEAWRGINSELATIDWLLYAFDNGKVKLAEVEIGKSC